MRAIIIIFAAVFAAFTASALKYIIKTHSDRNTVGAEKTRYTAGATGSVITDIPYGNYIEKCKPPEAYVIPEIGEAKSGEENSLAVSAAIDGLGGRGGVIYIPRGEYRISTIELKSNITLFVSEGARLISLSCDENAASPSPLYGGLIYARDAENIVITGGGTINGSGISYTKQAQTEKPLYALRKFNTYARVIEARKRIRFAREGFSRYSVIYLKNCSNVSVNNIILQESAFWTLVIDGGGQIGIRNTVIDNHMHVANTDGIDILNCDGVEITRCFIATADDGICLKPTQSKISNVAVSDCEVCSFANFFKIGTETACDVSDVRVTNCSFFIPDGMTYGYSGIAVESADGSNVSNISIDGINMDGVSSPVLIWLGKRMRYGAGKIGSIDGVTISNVTAVNTELPSAITGCRAGGNTYRVKNVRLKNINVKYRDTGERLCVRKPVPEWSAGDYPDIVRVSHRYFKDHKYSGYWDLPCYSLFIRYADNIDYSGYKAVPRSCSRLCEFYIKDLRG